MNTKRIFFQVAFCCLVFFMEAQFKPAEGAALHHNYVYFEDSLIKGTTSYELRIYASVEDARSGRALMTQKSKWPGLQIDNLTWGFTYYWQWVGSSAAGKEIIRPLHSFKIKPPVYQSFDTIALRVLQNDADKHAGGWIALDYARSVYDRAGQRIWTIPMIPGLVEERTHIRDIKFTKDNTITFLTIPIPLEIDLEGNVLWKAPFPFLFELDTVIYHHEFQKTERGTYLVLGDRKVWRRVPGAFAPEDLQTEFDVKIVNGEVYKKVLMAVVLEFNKEGKLIWYWDANKYVKDEDLNFKKTKRGFPNLATHANALSESADGKKIFVGFRDLSRLVKIDKLTGKVETSYGERYPSGEAAKGNGLFLNQHDAFQTNHRSLLIFNNNGSLATTGVSSILELREPCGPKDSLLLWSFALNFDTLSTGKSMNGGSVAELWNRNILLCGGSLNRLFEVTRDKKIVWDAFVLCRGKGDSQWQPMPQYRCHYVKEWRESHFLIDVKSLKTVNSQFTYDLRLINTGKKSGKVTVVFLNPEGKILKEVTAGPIKVGEVFPLKGIAVINEAVTAVRVKATQ